MPGPDAPVLLLTTASELDGPPPALDVDGLVRRGRRRHAIRRSAVPVAAALAIVSASVGLWLGDRGVDRAEPAVDGPVLWTVSSSLGRAPGEQLRTCSLDSMPTRMVCGTMFVDGVDEEAVPFSDSPVERDVPIPPSTSNPWPEGTLHSPRMVLVGTYDGTTLHLTETPVLDDGPPPAGWMLDGGGPDCEAPVDGWPVDRYDLAGVRRVQTYVAGESGWAAYEVDSRKVLRVAFTTDLDVHRAEIRELYDGPVCVVELLRTVTEKGLFLDAVSEELTRRGFQSVAGGVGDGPGPIYVTVTAATDAQKAALEAEFPGLVIDSFLTEY